MFLGVALTGGVLMLWLSPLNLSPLAWGALTVLCGLPAALDVFSQRYTTYRSNARRRMATGLLLGAAIVFDVLLMRKLLS